MTLKIRQRNLEIKRMAQALSESMFQTEQARIALARLHELMHDNFKLEETELIPLAEKTLSRDEIKDANNSVAGVLSPSRIAA
jgi:hypothetical protein